MKRYSQIIAGVLFFLTIFVLFFGVVQTVNAQPAGGTPTKPIPDGDLSTLGGYAGGEGVASVVKGAVNTVLNPLDTLMGWAASTFAEFLIWISGSFLWFAGKILDASIQFNVCNMKSLIGTAVVSQGWLIARNIANFFFIFILLYIAISIILNVGESQKRLIVWVVIIALVINFSAVLTRFVIDVSNIFAYQFYSSIVGGGDPCTAESSNAKGISTNYMTALDFQAYAREDSSQQSLYQGISGKSATMVGGIMTAIFLAITAWSFIIVAALMIIRSAVLMILIVLSPIAFMGFILPQIKQVMTKWWGALISQAFFAPVYLFFAYITLVLAKGTVALFSQETFASGSEQIFKIFLQYSILITLIVVGLVQAKKMSAAGGGAVQARVLKSLDWMRGQATGAIGRNTVGRLGRQIADSDRVKRWSSGSGGILKKAAGIPIKNASASMAGGKYGGGKSYDDTVKKQVERAKGIEDPADKARVLGGMSTAARREYFDSLSDNEKAETLDAARSLGGRTQKKVEAQRERLTTERVEKIEKAGGEIKEAARKKEQSADVEAVVGNNERGIAGLPRGSDERRAKIEKVVTGLKDDEGRKLAKIVEDADETDIATMYGKMNPLDLVDLMGKAKLSVEAKEKLRAGMMALGKDHPTYIELHSNPKLRILFGDTGGGGPGARTHNQSGRNTANQNQGTPPPEAYIG